MKRHVASVGNEGRFSNKNWRGRLFGKNEILKTRFLAFFEYFTSEITKELQMALKYWYKITLNFSSMKINDQIKVDL